MLRISPVDSVENAPVASSAKASIELSFNQSLLSAIIALAPSQLHCITRDLHLYEKVCMLYPSSMILFILFLFYSFLAFRLKI